MFALWELAKNRPIQDKLREEIMKRLRQIRSEGRDDFNADDFDFMPYLVAVVKVCPESSIYCKWPTPHSAQETLRVHPIASEIPRVPKKDMILPLATPIVGISGKIYKELPIPAGTFLSVSILGYNLYVLLWNVSPYK